MCFYALPLSVLTYIYLRIFWAARKNSRDIRRNNTSSSSGNPKSRFRGTRAGLRHGIGGGGGAGNYSLCLGGNNPSVTGMDIASSYNGMEHSVEDMLDTT